MGRPSKPEKAMLICAVFSRYAEAREFASHEISHRFGPVALISPEFAFSETGYYASSMGEGLSVQLLGFENAFDPARLGALKIETNSLEGEYEALRRHPEQRPLNIDPGYLTPSKFILATTKDASHRIYLSAGIFAEVTLRYQGGAWREQSWTYPNYRRPDYKAFLQQCRVRLMATS